MDVLRLTLGTRSNSSHSKRPVLIRKNIIHWDDDDKDELRNANICFFVCCSGNPDGALSPSCHQPQVRLIVTFLRLEATFYFFVKFMIMVRRILAGESFYT